MLSSEQVQAIRRPATPAALLGRTFGSAWWQRMHPHASLGQRRQRCLAAHPPTRRPWTTPAALLGSARGHTPTLDNACGVAWQYNWRCTSGASAVWRYASSPFDELVNQKGQAEIITEVALDCRCQEDSGCQPVTRDGGWVLARSNGSDSPGCCGYRSDCRRVAD